MTFAVHNDIINTVKCLIIKPFEERMFIVNICEILIRNLVKGDSEEISQNIKDYYGSCIQREQTVINDIFVELIGCSYETLIEMEDRENQGLRRK